MLNQLLKQGYKLHVVNQIFILLILLSEVCYCVTE